MYILNKSPYNEDFILKATDTLDGLRSIAIQEVLELQLHLHSINRDRVHISENLKHLWVEDPEDPGDTWHFYIRKIEYVEG